MARKKNIIDRVAATQKTLDQFKGVEFVDWQMDCLNLMAGHAKNMGRRVKLPKYHDRESAVAAMKELGFASLADAMDHTFTPIDKHDVLVSDIVELPGANGFSGLTVALGGGRVLGFYDGIPHCDVLQPVLISGAWRIE